MFTALDSCEDYNYGSVSTGMTDVAKRSRIGKERLTALDWVATWSMAIGVRNVFLMVEKYLGKTISCVSCVQGTMFERSHRPHSDPQVHRAEASQIFSHKYSLCSLVACGDS